jgi:hypothetical protein
MTVRTNQVAKREDIAARRELKAWSIALNERSYAAQSQSRISVAGKISDWCKEEDISKKERSGLKI